MKNKNIYVLLCIKLVHCPSCILLENIKKDVQEMINNRNEKIILLDYILSSQINKHIFITNLVEKVPCLILCSLTDFENVLEENIDFEKTIAVLSGGAKEQKGRFIDTDFMKIRKPELISNWIDDNISKVGNKIN